MKRYFFTLVACFFLHMHAFSYEIEGTVANIEDCSFKQKVYLSWYTSLDFDRTSKIIDSARIHSDGSFTIQSNSLPFKNVKDEQLPFAVNWKQQKMICRLYLVPQGSPSSYITGSKKHSIFLIVDKKTSIKIKANCHNMPMYTLPEASTPNFQLRALRQEVTGSLQEQVEIISASLDKAKTKVFNFRTL